MVVHRVRSLRAKIFVVDEGRLRFLRFDAPDGRDQSVVDLEDPDRVPMPYLRAAGFAATLAESPRRALIIGLGGGAFVGILRRIFPEIVVDAVEIDATVADVARKFFRLMEGAYLIIHIADGAAYLQSLRDSGTKVSYDIVLLDAYTGTGIPEHLTESAFFDAVRQRMGESGVVIANVGLESGEAEKRLIGRFARSFPGCIRLRTPEDDNLVLVGARRALPGAAELLRLATAVSRDGRIPFQVESVARTRRECESEPRSEKTG